MPGNRSAKYFSQIRFSLNQPGVPPVTSYRYLTVLPIRAAGFNSTFEYF